MEDDDDDEVGLLRYVTATRALQLCSVPLDAKFSLQSLRTALSGSASYTARALQNSRRLLALYLAGSTKPPDTFMSGKSSCVKFSVLEKKNLGLNCRRWTQDTVCVVNVLRMKTRCQYDKLLIVKLSLLYIQKISKVQSFGQGSRSNALFEISKFTNNAV